MLERRACSLRSIAPGPVPTQERKAQIGMVERLALHQATDSYRCGPLPQLDEIKSKSMACIARRILLLDVTHRIRNRADPPITDAIDIRRLVHELRQKGRVFRRKMPQR